MNRLIYTMLLVISGIVISACQEEEVPVYSDVDRVNFVGTSEDNEDDPDYMYGEKNFLAERGDVGVYVLRVKVQGRPSDVERHVYFTQRDSTVPGVRLEFGECTIPAGELYGECKVTINRPAEDEELISLVGFDYERSDFQRGTHERQEFMIKVYDQISYELLGIYDGFWDDNWMSMDLGSWSFTKAAFICRTLGITDFAKWLNDPAHWLVDWNTFTFVCHDKEKLVQALEEYKSNPDNPPLYDETLLPYYEEWIAFGWE